MTAHRQRPALHAPGPAGAMVEASSAQRPTAGDDIVAASKVSDRERWAPPLVLEWSR